MRKFRVVADTPLPAELMEMLTPHCEIVPWPKGDTPPHNPDGVDGVYTFGHPTVDGRLLDLMPNARVISNYGVGVDHIRLADAKARSIPVGNTPGVLDGATADLAFALMLAVARRVVEGDRYARSDLFRKYDPAFMLGSEVHGQTLGIIGLGRIGKQVAKRARAFDMPIVYHNRKSDPEAEALGAQYADLGGLLKQSDFVVLTVPLTGQTRGLIGAEELKFMKPTAFLINVARGPVVDQQALWRALDAKTIAGAALDVTDPEPLPRDHPLLDRDDVVILPHLGSATKQTRRKMAELSVANLLAGLRGQPLPAMVKV